jgi:muramoyltetrapeptide carboxypeptidase
MPPPSLPRIKPAALTPGDTIGIVAPASNVKRSDLDAGCENLRRAGYQPFYFDSILERDLYFAGSIERRARELEEMFARQEVKAIVCARGGYGSNYLLPSLDLEKIRKHPKIFVGYSDLTVLLTYFADAAGLVTFHGPMVAKDWAYEGGVNKASWQSALCGATPWEPQLGAGSGAIGLVEGAANGILYGGCLSILVASLGTPYEINTAGTILFLEDLAAKPYQIDRMLMHLKLSGKLKDVRGIVFGEMKDCIQTANQGYTLEEVIFRIVGDLGIPIAFGVRSGHVTKGNITLPIGVRAELTVERRKVNLKIGEAATAAFLSEKSQSHNYEINYEERRVLPPNVAMQTRRRKT